MEVIVVKSYHTFKNGQNFILEEEKFIFCDEIWCYIKEFAGWNYIFDLHKLGIDNLQHICKVNFKFEFSNMKCSLIDIKRRKNIIISYIYRHLKAPTKKPKKQIYENIMTYFNKKKIDERIKVGDEVIINIKKYSGSNYRCGIIKNITKSRLTATIDLYDYSVVKVHHTEYQIKYKHIWIKSSIKETIKVGSVRDFYTKEMAEETYLKFLLNYFNETEKILCAYR